MSWNTPRTWVDDEVVTAALLNAEIRDNFLVASAHAHGGAAGDGNDELAGLDSMSFDFIADPSAPGASKVIIYSKAGGLFYREGAAGAVLQISDAAHDHTFAVHTTGEALDFDSGGENIGLAVIAASGGGTREASITLTITDTTLVVASGASALQSNSNNWDLSLSIAGTDVDTDLSHSGADMEGLQGTLARTFDATVINEAKNIHSSLGRRVFLNVMASAINI